MKALLGLKQQAINIALKYVNILASGRKMGFSKKNTNAHGSAWELLRSCTGYGPR